MLNYIKAELYRTLHRKYFYIALALCAGLAVGVNLLLIYLESTGTARGVDTSFSLIMVGGMLFTASYVCPMLVTDLIFSEEYKLGTMKNTVSYGFTRTEIFFGKFIAELITALVFVAVLLLSFLGGAFLLGAPEGGAGPAVSLYFTKALLMLPLWLWSLALGHTAIFLVRNNAFFVLLTLGVLIMLPSIFCQYGVYIWPEVVVAAEPHLAYVRMQSVSASNFVIADFGKTVLDYWAAGLIRTAAVLAAGVLYFRTREIK